jgi:hypothetical protein
MNKLGFAVVGALSLVLAACGRNEADTLNEAEAQNYEAEALNDLAANAANAELEALGNQAQQLEAENAATEEEPTTNDGVTTSPSEVEDDVQGM